jgi:DNA-directed RNA polymerase subunit omega
MKKENPTEMKPAIDSKYRKILIAARRAKQIMKGARPRVEISGAKPTRIALAEIDRGMVNFEVTRQGEK